MAKHPLLLKKAQAGGWNIADPNGGASGEGKTREGLNAVLKQCQADVSKSRMAKWKVTLTDGKSERTEEVGGESYKGAEKAVQRKMKPGESIKSMTVAAVAPAQEIPEDTRPGGTGDYDFWKADQGTPAGEEEWIAMKEMGIRGSSKQAVLSDYDRLQDLCLQFVQGTISDNELVAACEDELGLDIRPLSAHLEEYDGGHVPANRHKQLAKKLAKSIIEAHKKSLDSHPELPPDDRDDPLCICGRRFYDHDENARVYKDEAKNIELCGGFMPVKPRPEDGLTASADQSKQECCGAFKPKHKEDCKKYNENFDKTIQRLKLKKGNKQGRYLTIAEVKEAYQKGVKEGRFVETAEGIRDTKDGMFIPWQRPDARVAQLREMSTSLKMAADELEKSAAPGWEVGDEVKASMGNGQFFRGEIESIQGDQAVVTHGRLKKTVPLAKLEEAHPVQLIPAETKSEPMGSMKPDDYCQACGNEVANRECAHGLVCDNCDAEIHGAVGAPCDVEDPVIYKKDFIVPDSALGGPRKRGAAPKRFPEEIKYPDSADGAIQCLKEISTIKTDGATARPDPSIRGVWEVKTPGGMRAIVYLGGYPDPMGNIRPMNDFEADDSKVAAESVGKRVLRKRKAGEYTPNADRMFAPRYWDELGNGKARQKWLGVQNTLMLHKPWAELDQKEQELVFNWLRIKAQRKRGAATGVAPAIQRNHIHNWRGDAEACSSCGKQRCKGRGAHTGFRCNKEAEQNGFCGAHQFQAEHNSSLKTTVTSKLLKKAVDDPALVAAAGAFLQYLKNTPEGRRADTQGPEMELPNPNWGPREPQAYAGIRDWGVWEIPPDAEGDTEDYDWKVLSRQSGQKLDEYQKKFKAEAKTKFPGMKFDIGGSEKNWLSITVTREKKPVKQKPVADRKTLQ